MNRLHRSPLMSYGSRDCKEGEWSNVLDVTLPHAVTVCTHCMDTAKDLSGSGKTEMLRSCYWLLMTATAHYTGIGMEYVYRWRSISMQSSVRTFSHTDTYRYIQVHTDTYMHILSLYIYLYIYQPLGGYVPPVFHSYIKKYI